MKRFLTVILCLILSFFSWSAVSGTGATAELEMPDWHTPGDGATPTPVQFLDMAQVATKNPKHLMAANAQGTVSYSLPIDLPPAILKPALSLNYSSEAGLGLETPYGWSLGGILEIRRPPVRGYTFDADKKYNSEFLVSGSGFSGTLLPSGKSDYRFFLHSSDPHYVSAKYNESADTWEVVSSDITCNLEAQDDGAKKSPDGTALWRVTEMKDGSGNHITFKYYDDGRIKKISYGGNATTAEDHLVHVTFTYAANAYTRTSASSGFLVKFAYHLSKINIKTGTSSASGINSVSSALSSLLSSDDDATTRHSYDLTTTPTDVLDLLTTIKRQGTSSADAETIATFTYANLDDSGAAPFRANSAPSSLGSSQQVASGSSGGMSRDETTRSLVDINRDGTPDLVDASDEDVETLKAWEVTSQGVDYDAEEFNWNASQSIQAVDGTLGSVSTDAFDISLSHTVAHTTRELIDFDGDGYLDMVESDSTSAWKVSYGQGVDREFVSYTETPPSGWSYSTESWRLNADYADYSGDVSPVVADRLNGFVDFNGDGWQDLYDPSSGVIWLNSGKRGGGWDEKVELGVAQQFEALRSVRYTLDDKELYTDVAVLCSEYAGYSEQDENGATQDSAAENEFNPEGSPDTTITYEAGGAATDEQDDPTMSDLMEKCTDAFENIMSNHKRQILYTDEVAGFYDMNGDGFLDFVVTNESSDFVAISDGDDSDWQVHLGNGHGFEDWVSWDNSPTKYLSHSDATKVYQRLLDVNADGLVDLVRTWNTEDSDPDKWSYVHDKEWFLNTGSGFEATARALSDSWPSELSITVSTNNIDDEDTSLCGTMLDLDHDGMVEYVSLDCSTDVAGVSSTNPAGADETVVTTSGVTAVGPYPRPYLLTKIENAQGGSTEVAYRPLSTVSPSGDDSKTHYTPNIKNLIDEIASKDAHTNQSSKTNFNYADGYYEDGVFQGFKTRHEKQTLNGEWLSHTEYEYELSRDLDPLPTTQKIYTDSNLNFSTNLSRGDVNKQVRYEIATAYTDYGDTVDFLHLPKTRTVTEYGEGGGDGKSVSYTAVYDDYGNLTSVTDDGGGDTKDIVVTNYAYVGDNADASEATFWRIKSKVVSGMDVLTDTQREFSVEKYYYDGHSDTDDFLTKGLVSKTETWAGWTANSEALSGAKLTIDYERGSRGELTKATDNATGITMSQTLGFGGAVLETQTNALGHKLTSTIDEQGRVTETQDSNGLKLSSAYDAFNRVTQKTATATDGKTYTLSDASYVNSTSPRYVKTQAYNTAGTVENTGYVLQDGFGETAQAWTQNASGKFLVQNSLHDLRGLVITGTHPSIETSFSSAVSMTTGSNPLQLQRYDAFGAPRDVTRDKTLGLKNSAVYFDKPWQQVSQDEKGYQTRLTFDAHRRITKVEQGKSDSYTTTGKYKYDPLGRVVEFKDGGGVYYDYSYDGAGRLRQVSYGNNSTATTTTVKTSVLGATGSSSPKTWYTYDYKGMLKTKMTDVTGAYTEWYYDGLGRVEKTVMTDGLPSSTGTLTYTSVYDTAWQGEITSTTDPLGTVTYAYDKLGRVKQSSRTYSGGTSATTPKFTYLYDLQGNVTTTTMPSGRKLKSTYKYGYLTKQSGATLGTTDYAMTFSYNKWGLLSTAKNTTGLTFTNTYTTPLWLNQIKISDGTNSTSLDYKWLDNGLLNKRTVAIKTATAALNSSTVYSFAYDSLRELTKITTPVKTIESYSYDAAGNLTTATDVGGLTWTYDAAGALNQIDKRTDSTGTTESYTYDDAGRTATSKTSAGTVSYYYDGSGRLRGTAKDGVVQMAIDYDSSGNVARKSDGNPFTDSPNYTYVFGNWRYDAKNAIYTESDNGFVVTQNGTRTWLMRDYDSHPGAMFDDKGSVQSRRNLGAYGATLSETGTPWKLQSYQGVEDEDMVDLYHMGQRHLMQKDGQWLQPEPLLYTGLPAEALTDPLKLAPYRYGRNTPTVYQDRMGNLPAVMLAVPAAETAGGVAVGPAVAAGATAWWQYETAQQWTQDVGTFIGSIKETYKTWGDSSSEQRLSNLKQLVQNQVSTWSPMEAEAIPTTMTAHPTSATAEPDEYVDDYDDSYDEPQSKRDSRPNRGGKPKDDKFGIKDQGFWEAWEKYKVPTGEGDIKSYNDAQRWYKKYKNGDLE